MRTHRAAGVCAGLTGMSRRRFKGMSVDDFLGGGFMEGEDDDEVHLQALPPTSMEMTVI